MEDVKSIDMMNYPNSIMEGWVDISEQYEFQVMARTTFKSMLPGGKFPSFEDIKKYMPALYGSQMCPYESIEEMVKDMDDLGYDKVVMVALKAWSYTTNTYMINHSLDLVNKLVQKSKGRIIGAASYDPFRIEESLREIEKAVKEYGFKYVYFHPITWGVSPRDRRCWPLYAKCNELNIAVGMQVGHSAEPLPSWVARPMEVDEIAINFPNLKINLSHTGYPWIEEWCSMAWKHPSVYGDVSAYMPRHLEPTTIRFMNGTRGRENVLFGTNGLGLRACKEQFMALDLKDETKQAVLRENAIRFLNL